MKILRLGITIKVNDERKWWAWEELGSDIEIGGEVIAWSEIESFLTSQGITDLSDNPYQQHLDWKEAKRQEAIAEAEAEKQERIERVRKAKAKKTKRLNEIKAKKQRAKTVQDRLDAMEEFLSEFYGYE